MAVVEIPISLGLLYKRTYIPKHSMEFRPHRVYHRLSRLASRIKVSPSLEDERQRSVDFEMLPLEYFVCPRLLKSNALTALAGTISVSEIA